jgi:dUTP pyrophosphatase
VLSKDTPVNSTTSQPELKIKKLHPKAQVPQYQSEQAIGLDLHSVKQVTIPAQGRALVPTGIAIECPQEHYARIAPRSGLSVKHSIDVGAGVIDPDYRGQVQVLLVNQKNQEYIVKEGERIAQMILEKASQPKITEAQELSETKRDQKGFGSTDQAASLTED